MRATLKVASVGLILLFLSTWGFGQEQRGTQNPPPGFQQPARYYLGSLGQGAPDQLLMTVNVWGFVQKPGQYLVPVNTNLVSLISYAGGPLEDASLRRVEVIRAAANDGQSPVIRVNIDEYLKKGDPALLPVLRPGDTVVVRASRMYGIRRVLDYVWRVAVIIQAYALFTFYMSRS